MKKPENTGRMQVERDHKGRFVKGISGNPAGKIPGTKNFDTLFEMAIKKIVKEKKLPVDDPEVEMVVRAIIEAMKGNYAYYRDIMDRRYGQPMKAIDLSTRDLSFSWRPDPEEQAKIDKAFDDLDI